MTGFELGRQTRSARGFTIVELLVVISIIGLLIAILLPAIAKARDNALVNLSRSNLRNLGVANAAYWSDFRDRQPTFVPDDWGSLPPCGDSGGCGAQAACQNYQSNYGCVSQLIAGYDGQGFIWGIWIPGPFCPPGLPGSCELARWYTPIHFPGTGPGTAGDGSFRLPTIKQFFTYVNGRWYDPVFFAPKDRLALDAAEKHFGEPGEYNSDGTGQFTLSSYCWSPAAMWNPEVMGGTDAPPCRQWKSPNGGNSAAARNPNAYRSPSSSQAKFPSLKTLMIEHNWLQNPPPQLANPNFTGGKTAWFFNHGYNSNPVCLFFDLSINMKGCWEAMQADNRARSFYTNPPSGQGDSACNARGALWARDTGFGAQGYFGAQSYDNLVNTSFHILTRNGVAGRDFLSESAAN